MGKLEIIQQWQYVGDVHPKLLEERVLEQCKAIGITSLQSYVYWAEIEKKPGVINFATYDVLVEKLKSHGLKWVPFLILGPYYATPRWFQGSEESVFAKCMEHEQESRIQSIWNPYLPEYVQRFLRLISEHYCGDSVLESIILGISGNWGESLYPSTGCFYGGFHTHPGWWCRDKYAIEDFQRYIIQKYGSLKELNISWKSGFQSVSEITMPAGKSDRQNPPLKSAVSICRKLIPDWLKPLMYNIRDSLLLKKDCDVKFGNTGPIQQQADFAEWYTGSMTKWVEFWLKLARDYFPNNKIYVATGGNGSPKLGADFSAQVKVASTYDAGIRITNLTDDYPKSFMLSRLVSSASRFYDAYFSTEEALINSPKGITMRLFDAVSSGANGVYFKGLIGTGTNFCTGKNVNAGEPTQGAVNLGRFMKCMQLSKPVIEVAVLFPNTSIAIHSLVLDRIHFSGLQLRNLVDFDLVDENMIADGGLNNYRFLVILDGNLVKKQTMESIINWISDGGIVIVSGCLNMQTIDEAESYLKLFFQEGGLQKAGKGYAILSSLSVRSGRKFLKFIAEAISNCNNEYPWKGIPNVKLEWDGVYTTMLRDKMLYYDSKRCVIWDEVYGKSRA
jgi:hypothetical protein